MTPLVLLAGMMCDARLYRHQIASINGRAVMVALITNHDTMAALAEEVLANAPAHFALAGLSMGGIVAMEIIRQAPQRVAKLCLMDTNPLAEIGAVQANRDRHIALAEAGRLEVVMREEMKPRYLADNNPQRGAILDLCLAMALALGKDVFIRQSRALQNRIDQTDTLARYTQPTLILHGEADSLCPPERHQLMHRLMPHATYQRIVNAGHLPTLEQPERTTELLQRWLYSDA